MTDYVIDKELQRKSRIKIVAVFAVFLGPLLLAFIWLQTVKNNPNISVSTHGELIKPAHPLEPFTLSEADGEAFSLQSFDRFWTMIYFSGGPCAEACEKNLYHMRQVRLALVQNMDRVQRVVVVDQQSDIAPELLAEHEGLHVLGGDPQALEQFRQQFRNAQSAMQPAGEAIYLVDPLGNLMMRFSGEVDPKGILKDLKHLLKVSRIG
ncbi:MAG: SCO family protein [Gammaproteobacteria bacterium]|nr:SCO family protein [Gammaproteobacteria bacterium]